MTNEKYLQQARKLLGIGEFKRTPDIKTLEAILERESVQPIHIMPDGSLSDSAPVQAIAEALAEKDALLREALDFGPAYKPELKGWVSRFVEWQKKVRASLGNPPKQEGGE